MSDGACPGTKRSERTDPLLKTRKIIDARAMDELSYYWELLLRLLPIVIDVLSNGILKKVE